MMWRVIAVLSVIASAAPAWCASITIFAAASLQGALDKVAADWNKASGNQAVISYGGSALLARQIAAGAPADVFLSANEEWMDQLEASGDLWAGTRRDLLGNSLVLIATGAKAKPVDLAAGTDLAGLLGDGRLAMGMVDSVPAGIYGKAALVSLGQWTKVAPHVAQTDNVRAALALVSLGEAPYGIVYATDAAADPGVRAVATFPEDSHPPIRYPAAVTRQGDPQLGSAFLTFLAGPEARARFEAQGFRVLP